MKDIIKDIFQENFTGREVIIYGIVVPVAFILGTGFVTWLLGAVL